MATRTEQGDKWQERGRRGRMFTVQQAAGGFHGPRMALCTFEGGSKRRGEGPRTVLVFNSTLAKRFVRVPS